MLKSVKLEDFVNGEWVNDSNGLLDSVDLEIIDFKFLISSIFIFLFSSALMKRIS